MKYTRWKLMSMFRAFYTDYLTIENYAEVYDVSKDEMFRMLNIGRKLHNKNANRLKQLI